MYLRISFNLLVWVFYNGCVHLTACHVTVSGHGCIHSTAYHATVSGEIPRVRSLWEGGGIVFFGEVSFCIPT